MALRVVHRLTVWTKPRAMARCLCTGQTAPVNIQKSGTDPPILADDQYPDWVHSLSKSALSKAEMEKRGYFTLTVEEQARYHQLNRREDIKKHNALKAKK